MCCLHFALMSHPLSTFIHPSIRLFVPVSKIIDCFIFIFCCLAFARCSLECRVFLIVFFLSFVCHAHFESESERVGILKCNFLASEIGVCEVWVWSAMFPKYQCKMKCSRYFRLHFWIFGGCGHGIIIIPLPMFFSAWNLTSLQQKNLAETFCRAIFFTLVVVAIVIVVIIILDHLSYLYTLKNVENYFRIRTPIIYIVHCSTINKCLQKHNAQQHLLLVVCVCVCACIA